MDRPSARLAKAAPTKAPRSQRRRPHLCLAVRGERRLSYLLKSFWHRLRLDRRRETSGSARQPVPTRKEPAPGAFPDTITAEFASAGRSPVPLVTLSALALSAGLRSPVVDTLPRAVRRYRLSRTIARRAADVVVAHRLHRRLQEKLFQFREVSLLVFLFEEEQSVF